MSRRDALARLTLVAVMALGLLMAVSWLLRPQTSHRLLPFRAAPVVRVPVLGTARDADGAPAFGPAGSPGALDPARSESGVTKGDDERVRLVVLGPDGLPRSGARVWLLAPDGISETPLGATDAGGVAIALRSQLEGREVAVRAPGLAAFRAETGPLGESEGEIVIRMRGACTIRGLLVDGRDAPLNRSGRVAVWAPADGSEVGTLGVLGRTRDGPVLRRLQTDEAGRFAFEEAEPGETYRFVAALPGFVSAGGSADGGGVLASSEIPEVRIPLEALHAVVVRVRDASGRSMHIRTGDLPMVKQNLGGLPKAGYEIVAPNWVAARWAMEGLPQPGMAEDGDFVSVWTLRKIRESTEPLVFHFAAPEYGTVSAQVAPHAVAGPMEAHVLTASRHPTGPTGSLRLRIAPSSRDPETARILGEGLSRIGGSLVAVLKPVSGSSMGRRREIPGAFPADLVFEDVEVGEYRIGLMGPAGSVRTACDPEIVEVLPGRESECSLETPAGPCLVLDVEREDGSPWRGPLRVEFLWGRVSHPGMEEGRYADRVFFLGPPYRVLFAPSGDVEVTVNSERAGTASATVNVPAEGAVRLGLRLQARTR